MSRVGFNQPRHDAACLRAGDGTELYAAEKMLHHVRKRLAGNAALSDESKKQGGFVFS